MSGPTRILVVDDEQSITDFIALGLRHEGFEVRTAPDGHVALRVVDEFKPHLVVLDLMMPRVDGWQLCRALSGDRSRGIIILSARDETSDRIQGLELGADDYLVKPFGLRELVARIRAVSRRAGPQPPIDGRLLVGDLIVDTRARRALLGQRELKLTAKEFDLLAALAAEPGAAVTRRKLFENVWESHWFGSTKTIDVHVASLRRKLGDPGWIETVRGVGFRLQAPS